MREFGSACFHEHSQQLVLAALGMDVQPLPHVVRIVGLPSRAEHRSPAGDELSANDTLDDKGPAGFCGRCEPTCVGHGQEEATLTRLVEATALWID